MFVNIYSHRLNYTIFKYFGNINKKKKIARLTA